mmetsp:Transcript_12415/g.31339  ORF Transcript_12415/g.31339 Transcript_12415/m.31339 type:complete len:360 (-) Transcript_12415:792-1871(-)
MAMSKECKMGSLGARFRTLQHKDVGCVLACFSCTYQASSTDIATNMLDLLLNYHLRLLDRYDGPVHNVKLCALHAHQQDGFRFAFLLACILELQLRNDAVLDLIGRQGHLAQDVIHFALIVVLHDELQCIPGLARDPHLMVPLWVLPVRGVWGFPPRPPLALAFDLHHAIWLRRPPEIGVAQVVRVHDRHFARVPQRWLPAGLVCGTGRRHPSVVRWARVPALNTHLEEGLNVVTSFLQLQLPHVPRLHQICVQGYMAKQRIGSVLCGAIVSDVIVPHGEDKCIARMASRDMHLVLPLCFLEAVGLWSHKSRLATLHVAILVCNLNYDIWLCLCLDAHFLERPLCRVAQAPCRDDFHLD